MDPVSKALWYIETHLEQEFSMEDVAQSAGVTRFHLSRLFAVVIGQSVMRYARGRRLSLAAAQLVNGARDILSVALQFGYSSHEAFSRAFREQFGATPESVRAQGLAKIKLQEPLRMNPEKSIELLPPRFETAQALLIAGIKARYKQGGDPGIPAQWQRFNPYIGALPEQINYVTYGIVANVDDDECFDYIAGVEVKSFADLPTELDTLRIPAAHCAVFTHKGHVSGIKATIVAIWREWLPASGRKAADAAFYERYDDRFDGRTGNGEVELWLPLEP